MTTFKKSEIIAVRQREALRNRLKEATSDLYPYAGKPTVLVNTASGTTSVNQKEDGNHLRLSIDLGPIFTGDGFTLKQEIEDTILSEIKAEIKRQSKEIRFAIAEEFISRRKELIEKAIDGLDGVSLSVKDNS